MWLTRFSDVAVSAPDDRDNTPEIERDRQATRRRRPNVSKLPPRIDRESVPEHKSSSRSRGRYTSVAARNSSRSRSVGQCDLIRGQLPLRRSSS